MSQISTGRRLGFLRAVPIFDGLEPIDLAAIDGLLSIQEMKKGDRLFLAGDPSEALYLLADGELEVVDGPSGEVLRRVHAPDVVGEVGLVLGGPRTADVIAARPCTVFVLAASDFRHLAAREPSIMENVCAVLARRLAAPHGPEASRPRCTVVGITAVPGSACVAELVARSLEVQLPTATLIEPTDRLADQVATIARRREQHRWIITQIADGEPRALVDEVCDVVITVTDRFAGTTPPRYGDRVTRLAVLDARRARSPIAINAVEPFVVTDDGIRPGAVEGVADFLREHPRHPFSTVMGRLARRLQGGVIGIALGGGAALGIAHIGVLQVLEREGIPIDVLAGTSMGSIVAVGYATGISADEMVEIARSTGRDWRKLASLVDLNPLHSGILSGDRMQAILSPFLGDLTDFEQLTLPCRTVACDIDSGERIEWCDGALIDAARASSAIPIIVSPSRQHDRVLVDGAIVDPVPAEVVRTMGADRVIAVNVVPHLDPSAENALTRASRLLAKVNPIQLVRPRASVNVLDVALNTIQSLQHELGHYKAASADVRLDPALGEFTWLDFWHADRIIERGVEAAEAALPELKELLTADEPVPAPR